MMLGLGRERALRDGIMGLDALFDGCWHCGKHTHIVMTVLFYSIS